MGLQKSAKRSLWIWSYRIPENFSLIAFRSKHNAKNYRKHTNIVANSKSHLELATLLPWLDIQKKMCYLPYPRSMAGFSRSVAKAIKSGRQCVSPECVGGRRTLVICRISPRSIEPRIQMNSSLVVITFTRLCVVEKEVLEHTIYSKI